MISSLRPTQRLCGGLDMKLLPTLPIAITGITATALARTG